MLAIRMQRTGRKGHAMFRVVVQDSRLTPTSGKFVAQLGSYDPHAKVAILDKEKASFYLDHGAQPSDRVARLLQGEGVKLPEWVKLSEAKAGKLRNPEKLRKNQPKEEKPTEEAIEEVSAEAKA
ncbi:MAG TPA: 30S ribosomal protein S16 [Candidatus Saccharimonadales bacterium]|nr:30S ribosomal protein S16 [Candidatus Saccharimonadales bacterium]